MAIFSKPLRLHYTCYELGHCWTPHCVQASTDIVQDVFREAIKIYGALYLFTALIRRKGLNYYFKKFIPETLRSALFLTVNGTFFVTTFCLWRRLVGFYTFYDTFVCGMPSCAVALLIERKNRRLLGCFYFINSAFLPTFFAAVTAMLVERKDRRAPLAIYITNLAIETGYRMLMNRGIVGPVQNGEVLLFSLASAVYLYLFRKKDGLPTSTMSVFKFLVGSDESPDSRTKDSNRNPALVAARHDVFISSSDAAVFTTVVQGRTVKSTRSALEMFGRVPGVHQVVQVILFLWRSLVKKLEMTPRHVSCSHSYGCVHYVLQGFCKMFGLGYLVQLLIKLVSALSAARRKPVQMTKLFFSGSSVGLATFLGLYSAVFRGVNCSLRWLRQKDEAIHGMLAGFLAGGAMYFYKSITVALFMTSKLGEILYFKGIDKGMLPYIPNAEVFIYAFSCAFVFHAAVLEPHSLRPTYWKWLMRITNNKFSQMNRKLLDEFGTGASTLFPDYWPDYDPRYTSLTLPPST